MLHKGFVYRQKVKGRNEWRPSRQSPDGSLVVQQELQPQAGRFSEGQKSRSSSDSNMVLKAAAKVLIKDPAYESQDKVRHLLQTF